LLLIAANLTQQRRKITHIINVRCMFPQRNEAFNSFRAGKNATAITLPITRDSIHFEQAGAA
jgi:hypothetical protein